MLPSEKPPLAAWPKCAFPGEGAHGWFQRLAVANGQISARTLAESQGLNGRHPRPASYLDYCLRFPVANPDALIEATPVLDRGVVVLRGQSFHYPLDFSFDRPRVCPGCVAEERYYRSWFDIQLLRGCPIHGRVLTGGAGDDRLAWWHPKVGVTPAGTDLADGSRSPDTSNFGWERYVLGRLGVVERSLVPLIDDAGMIDLSRAAVLLGKAQESGWTKTKNSRGASRARLAAVGFDILSRGEVGLEEYFTSVLQNATRSSHDEGASLGSEGLFGWLPTALASDDASSLSSAIRSALEQAAHGSGFYPRRSATMPTLPEGHLRLFELAKRLGLTTTRTLKLALRLGLTKPVPSAAASYAFPERVVTEIQTALDTSIARADAAGMLGLSPVDLQVLIDAGELVPLGRIGGATRASDRFMRDDLASLLVRIPGGVDGGSQSVVSFSEFCRASNNSAGSVALQIIRGERAVAGRADDAEGFLGCLLRRDEAYETVHRLPLRKQKTWNGLPAADAAAAIGVCPTAIAPLVKEGYLARLAGGPRLLSGISPESLDRFCAEFTPARVYADFLAIPHQAVLAKFRHAGIRALSGGGLGRYSFVRRADVERLGPKWRLSARCPVEERFWIAVRAYLSGAKSTNRLVGGFGGVAKLRSGGLEVTTDITFCATRSSVKLTLAADKRVAPALHQKLGQCRELFRAHWPTARETRDEESGLISLSESFRFDPQSFADAAPQIARAIDDRTTVARYILRNALERAIAPRPYWGVAAA